MNKLVASDKRKNTYISLLILAVYSLVTFFGVIRHELWFDEAQAWGIARDATFDNFFEALRHEGHPGLWHIILMPFAKLGLGCGVINVISWAFTSIGAGIFLLRAPFGLFLKTVTVLSSGFLYYTSVNARVYCLIPLLLFSIAWIFPKREKRPVAFGLLVGLLANTHIMMSGMVCALGIIMFVELVLGIKTKGIKNCKKRIAGLAVAGAMVLLMLVAVVGSLSANNMVQSRKPDFIKGVTNCFSVFFSIGKNLMNSDSTPADILANIVGILIVVAIILVTLGFKKPAVMCGLFTLFYALTVEVVWYTTPLRAPVFVYTYLSIMWIAVENESGRKIELDVETKSGFEKKAGDFINSVLKNPGKSICGILCVVMLASVPSGVYSLINDYKNEIVLTEKTAEFIKNELPENSVMITENQVGIQFNVYYPDMRLYSLELQRFITYNPHEISDEEIDYNKVYDDLKDEKNLYLIYYDKKDFSDNIDLSDEKIVFYDYTDIPSYAYTGAVLIKKVSIEDVVGYPFSTGV